MNKCSILALSLLLVILPSASFASAPVADPEVPATPPQATVSSFVSPQAAHEGEMKRRELIAAHTSWRWVIQTRSQGASGQKDAVLAAMQGVGPNGPVRALILIDTQGQPVWMVLEHQDDQGKHIQQVRENFESDDWSEISNDDVKKRVFEATGAKADLATLNDWMSGIPSRSTWPSHFIQDDAGVHPVKASLEQGEILWGKWSALETGKGQSLALPGGWMLSRKGYEGLFLRLSIEAYEPDELPNPGWPFVSKENAQKMQLDDDEPPIARDDQLDYNQW